MPAGCQAVSSLRTERRASALEQVWKRLTAGIHKHEVHTVKSGLGNILKQAQKMQEDLQKAQEKLAQEVVTGESGGGMVKVIMNGRHEVKRVEIDDSLMTDDKEMLEDLVAAAVNAAAQRVSEKTQENMAGLTSGLSLPPGFKMPF